MRPTQGLIFILCHSVEKKASDSFEDGNNVIQFACQEDLWWHGSSGTRLELLELILVGCAYRCNNFKPRRTSGECSFPTVRTEEQTQLRLLTTTQNRGEAVINPSSLTWSLCSDHYPAESVGRRSGQGEETVSAKALRWEQAGAGWLRRKWFPVPVSYSGWGGRALQGKIVFLELRWSL